MEISAVLFDMDGVLVDSKEAWFKSFREIDDMSRERFESKFWGRDLKKNLKDLDVSKERFCDVIYGRHLDDVKAFDKVKEVLSGIKVPKAVITNTTETCTRKILDQHSLSGFFDKVVTRDQVEEGKPEPDLVLKACQALEVDPSRAVVVGDSEHDIQAGRGTGCMTVGIGVDADIKIRHIKELPAALRRLIRGDI